MSSDVSESFDAPRDGVDSLKEALVASCNDCRLASDPLATITVIEGSDATLNEARMRTWCCDQARIRPFEAAGAPGRVWG